MMEHRYGDRSLQSPLADPSRDRRWPALWRGCLTRRLKICLRYSWKPTIACSPLWRQVSQCWLSPSANSFGRQGVICHPVRMNSHLRRGLNSFGRQDVICRRVRMNRTCLRHHSLAARYDRDAGRFQSSKAQRDRAQLAREL